MGRPGCHPVRMQYHHLVKTSPFVNCNDYMMHCTLVTHVTKFTYVHVASLVPGTAPPDNIERNVCKTGSW